MKKYQHDRELWDTAEELLEQIKQDYGIFGISMDDVALTDIRGSLIKYAEYCMEKSKPKKVKVG